MEMVENLKAEKIKINGIPSMLWGEKSNKIFIAVHGNMSNKEDEVIKILAQKVISKGYQLLSFDLPEHGERKEDKTYLCKVQNCVRDLSDIMAYAKEKYDEINYVHVVWVLILVCLHIKTKILNNVYFYLQLLI